MPGKHKYSSFDGKKNIFPFAAAMLAAGMLGIPAAAAGQPQTDILSGPTPDPCETGADYVPAAPDSGIVPADLDPGFPKSMQGSVQPEISVRLPHSHGTRVTVDAGSVLNPQPTCGKH